MNLSKASDLLLKLNQRRSGLAKPPYRLAASRISVWARRRRGRVGEETPGHWHLEQTNSKFAGEKAVDMFERPGVFTKRGPRQRGWMGVAEPLGGALHALKFQCVQRDSLSEPFLWEKRPDNQCKGSLWETLRSSERSYFALTHINVSMKPWGRGTVADERILAAMVKWSTRVHLLGSEDQQYNTSCIHHDN